MVSGTALNLEALISPKTATEFFDTFWEKSFLLLTRNQPQFFSELVCQDEIQKVLDSASYGAHEIRLAHAERAIYAHEYLNSNTVDIPRVSELFWRGSTVIVSGAHRRHAKLAALCKALSLEFGARVQTNIYITPPNAQGLPPHYDTHCVLILQIHGRKKWRIYDSPITLPLQSQLISDQQIDQYRSGSALPSHEFELGAGDTAYIPRGVVHAALTTDSVSTHVTVGVLACTWADLLLTIVANQCFVEASLRHGLLLGRHLDVGREIELYSLAKTQLRQISDNLTMREFTDALRSIEPFTQPTVYDGQLAESFRASSMDCNDRLVIRPFSYTRLDVNGKVMKLYHSGKVIEIDPVFEDFLRTIFGGQVFSISDARGALPLERAQALVRKLLYEGLVIAAR